jgi:hypothetical protein
MWSEPKVRRFLDKLEDRRMISRNTDAGITVVTIRNYDVYQNTPRGNGAADDAARTTDPTLVRMLSKANRWMQALQDGTALIEITRRDDHAESYVSTRIPLAFLSPRIQAAILDGTRPRHLSLEHILRVGIPLDWIEQERIFGFNGHTAPSLF